MRRKSFSLPLGETFATSGARERLLSCVDHLVADEVAAACVRLVAYLARERSVNVLHLVDQLGGEMGKVI